MSHSNKKTKSFLVETILEKPCTEKQLMRVQVDASNEKDAHELVQKAYANVSSIKIISSPLPAIILFSITLVMSLFKYFDGFDSIVLFPNIISLFFSILVYCAFVIRSKGVENTFKNKSDTILSILFILVFAIFIKIFVGESTIPSGFVGKLLNKIGIGNNWLLICGAILLSWLGIKQIAGFVWIAVVVLGLVELTTCGSYMGNIKGCIFLLSAFVGFVFYLKYEGKLIINSFKDNSSYIFESINFDIIESKNLSNVIVKDSVEKIKEKNSQRKQKKLTEGKNEK